MTRICLLAVLLFVTACGGSKAAETGTEDIAETTAGETPAEAEPVATAETAPEDVLANDGTRKIGDITKCPVSGDVFEITDAMPSVEHDGGTYYLCCKGCVAKFEAEPAKFLAGTATPHEHSHHDSDAAAHHDH